MTNTNEEVERLVETLAMAITHSEQGEYAKNEQFVRESLTNFADKVRGEEREKAGFVFNKLLSVPTSQIGRELMQYRDNFLSARQVENN